MSHYTIKVFDTLQTLEVCKHRQLKIVIATAKNLRTRITQVCECDGKSLTRCYGSRKVSHVVASTLSLLSRGVIFKFSNDFDYSSIDFNNNTVKSHFKALGFYNFKRGFGWAYKRGGGLISGCMGL